MKRGKICIFISLFDYFFICFVVLGRSQDYFTEYDGGHINCVRKPWTARGKPTTIRKLMQDLKFLSILQTCSFFLKKAFLLPLKPQRFFYISLHLFKYWLTCMWRFPRGRWDTGTQSRRRPCKGFSVGPCHASAELPPLGLACSSLWQQPVCPHTHTQNIRQCVEIWSEHTSENINSLVNQQCQNFITV